VSTSTPLVARRASLVPTAAEDGLGLAALLDLLGIDPSGDPPVPGRRPVDLLARTRARLHRAADWGAGPQRSWCAW
jgi:hypothetical protein